MKSFCLNKLYVLGFSLLLSLCFSTFGAFTVLLIGKFGKFKTDFFSNFSFLFLIFILMMLALLFVNTIKEFREILNLSKKWNIEIKEIIDGIYTYEIEKYWNLNARQFLETLDEARHQNKLSKNEACG